MIIVFILQPVNERVEHLIIWLTYLTDLLGFYYRHGHQIVSKAGIPGMYVCKLSSW